MTSDAPIEPFPDQPPRPRWRLPKSTRWWIALLLCCALFAGASRTAEFRRRRHEAREQTYRAKHQALSHRIGLALGNSMSMVQAEFNEGQPLREQPVDLYYRYRIDGVHVDPNFGGWQIVCRFKNDRLYGAFLIPPPRTPYRIPSNTWIELERLRRYLIPIAAGCWLLGVFMLPLASRWRRDVAQICLAAVLVAALAWSLDPQHVWTWQDWRQTPAILIAAGLFISLIALVKPLRLPDIGHAVCSGCGYDLTGNRSGVCPECGQPTPRGRAERWQADAERIEQVAEVPLPEDLPQQAGFEV